MSRTSIPEKVVVQLWTAACGRCQYAGCNEVLWRDELTLKRMNRAYIAHIISDKPRGPRGDTNLSKKLAKDISNLMLMCDSHHRLIDKVDIDGHPVSLLQKMKKAHEERMELLASLRENQKSLIVMYEAN